MRTLVVSLSTPRMLTYEWFRPVLFLCLLLQRSHLVSLLRQDRHYGHQIILYELGDDGLVGLGKNHHLTRRELIVAQYAASIATNVHGSDKGGEEICCLCIKG